MRKLKPALCILTALAALLLASTIAAFVRSYHSYSKIVDARLANGYLTSRAGVYAAPRILRPGQTVTRDRLVSLLRRAGYIESFENPENTQPEVSDVWSGSFSARENTIAIRPRNLNTHNRGQQIPGVVEVALDEKSRIKWLARDGNQLTEFGLEPELITTDSSLKAGSRAALAYSDVPPVLVHAVLSIEDRRFFEHPGVDVISLARALLRNLADDSFGQGGSTITQQLVKNTYLSPEKTFRRKFAEAMLAFTLEKRLSKQDIFALYANEVYLGQRGAIGVRGVEQGARLFFGKALRDLTVAEAATLAGLIQGPGRYSPDRHLDAAIGRRNVVIAGMARDGFISSSEATAAASESMALIAPPAAQQSLAPYFLDHVNRLVDFQLENSTQADERSPRIYTTIDLDLQEASEAAIKRQTEKLDSRYKTRGATPQAALVAIDPRTGNVLAMVGGRNYTESQLNRVTDARRQPGSVFKPFVYAAAIESGISPLTMIADAPREFAYAENAVYRPSNYGGGFSMRDVTMRTGLVKSLNVVTVDVAMRAGLKHVARVAEEFGLPKPAAYPALALGTTAASPLQMAAAYTAFVNQGARVEPIFIERIANSSGAAIMAAGQHSRKVVDPTTAYMLTDMLSAAVDHGTARAARGAVKRTVIAGKTGTSRDGWFVGFTPNLVCAVWVGFDDNKQLGLTGAEAALPAWTDFIKEAIDLRPELGGQAFERPEGLVNLEIDPETGQLALPGCPQRERIAIVPSMAPYAECFKHAPSIPADLLAQDSTADRQSVGPLLSAESAAVSAKHKHVLPHSAVSAGLSSLSIGRGTAIDTYSRTKPTLVSEMRVIGHGTQ